MTSSLTDRVMAAADAFGGGSSDYDLNAGATPKSAQPLRAAAVLIAVCARPEGPAVLLTKRSAALKHHPGQVALPGGKVDPGDADSVAAAVREAKEETGLAPDLIKIGGVLPAHETVTGFSIAPVLARVEVPFDPVPEPGEVSEAFFVPLAFLMQPENYGIEGRMWRGALRKYYAVPYGPYYVWGATARILRGLAARVSA